MSTSSFSEKAAPLWPKRLNHTFQTIKFGEDVGNLLSEKFKKIEEEFNNVKNLLSAVKDREQKQVRRPFHFVDLNGHLRKIADYGNISLTLDEFNLELKTIEASSKKLQTTVEGSNKIEGELHVLLKRLRDTIIKNNGDQDPLVMELNKTEGKLNYITSVFHRVKQWEQELLDYFKEMDHYLRNFDGPKINALAKCIHAFIGETEYLLGGEWQRQRTNGRVTDATNFEKALSALKRRVRLTILCKNADEPLIANLKRFEEQLNTTRDFSWGVKEWERQLVTQLADLDGYLRRYGVPNIESVLDRTIVKLRELANQLQQISSIEHEHKEDEDQTKKNHPHPQVMFSKTDLEIDEANSTATRIFLESDPCNSRRQLRDCLMLLTIFPKDAVIKKRPLIYLWLGEGVIATEDKGEEIFEELLNVNLIIPFGSAQSPVVNQVQIHPVIHSTLVSLRENVELFNFDAREIVFYNEGFDPFPAGTLIGEEAKSGNLRTIFNVEEGYFSLERKWLAELKHLVVLQLGRWHGSREHHIQVQGEEILKGLGAQKHLKYLSLRGIFGITALPDSIFKLKCLEILDLKACSNLETFPPGIASLKKLTHLDISECYLLGSMPEGLHKLSSLQVLKGFVIGYSKNYTPCRIGDLAKLQNLKRLSICIGNDSAIEDKELESLKDLVSLRRLKIVWDVISPERIGQIKKQCVTFPPCLEKLDLEGIPHDKMSEWLKPSELKELKKLSIRGGKLRSLKLGESHKFNVEILILKYLENLQIELSQLLDMFPHLIYVQRDLKVLFASRG